MSEERDQTKLHAKTWEHPTKKTRISILTFLIKQIFHRWKRTSNRTTHRGRASCKYSNKRERERERGQNESRGAETWLECGPSRSNRFFHRSVNNRIEHGLVSGRAPASKCPPTKTEGQRRERRGKRWENVGVCWWKNIGRNSSVCDVAGGMQHPPVRYN